MAVSGPRYRSRALQRACSGCACRAPASTSNQRWLPGKSPRLRYAIDGIGSRNESGVPLSPMCFIRRSGSARSEGSLAAAISATGRNLEHVQNLDFCEKGYSDAQPIVSQAAGLCPHVVRTPASAGPQRRESRPGARQGPSVDGKRSPRSRQKKRRPSEVTGVTSSAREWR